MPTFLAKFLADEDVTDAAEQKHDMDSTGADDQCIAKCHCMDGSILKP